MSAVSQDGPIDRPLPSPPGGRSKRVVFAIPPLHYRTEPGDPSDVRVASTDSFLSSAQAGRLAALLYLGSSAASILSLPFPQPAGADRWHLLIISAVALAI